MPGLTKFVERFSDEDKYVLGHFFTNTDKGTFALQNLPEDTKAALFARYSRSAKSMRRLFLDEFIKDPDTGQYYEGFFEHMKALDAASKFRVGGSRAQKLVEVVVAQYGDDSVIDSASGHIALEGVDQITAKDTEDGRLAGYIEKSSRYVSFVEQLSVDSEGFVTGKTAPGESGGRFLYKEYPEIQYSNLSNYYVATMDTLFNTVAKMHESVSKKLRKAKPIEEQTFDIKIGERTEKVKFADISAINGIDVEKEMKKAQSAYNISIKAKTFDLTRGPLPASTMTNLGWHASFRSFDHSLVKLLASDFKPSVETADAAYAELFALEPSLIKRVKEKHGTEEVEYLRKQKNVLKELARELEPGTIPRRVADTELVYTEDDRSSALKVAAATLYPHSDLSIKQILSILSNEGDEAVSKIINAATSGRTNRRHKPPRSFENAQAMLEFEGNFGIFRDLQRNRFTLQVRQKLTTSNGYDMPPVILDAGMEGVFKDAMEASDSLHMALLDKLPEYAETAVTFAHRVKWIATCDMRQASWFFELRSGPQGHPDYRRRAQLGYNLLHVSNPTLVNESTMPFIDMREYDLERLSAAHKTEQKLESIRAKSEEK